jgi:hypothetical protein
MTNDMEKNASGMLANPFYAVSFADYMSADDKTEIAKEDWVLNNTGLIDEMGIEDWLKQLLISLTTEPEDSPTYTIISPRNVVIVSERLRGEHKPIITRQQWLQVNTKLMKELGTEAWLWRLIDILETGGPEGGGS